MTAVTLDLDLDGLLELQGTIKGIAKDSPQAAAKGLVRLASQIMRDAKAITPVDTGVLRASGTVLPPEYPPEGVTVTLGFGGAASEYALVQHENLLYKHEPPGQALYLETALRQHAPEVADAMREALDEFIDQWAEAKERAYHIEADLAEEYLRSIGT